MGIAGGQLYPGNTIVYFVPLRAHFCEGSYTFPHERCPQHETPLVAPIVAYLPRLEATDHVFVQLGTFMCLSGRLEHWHDLRCLFGEEAICNGVSDLMLLLPIERTIRIEAHRHISSADLPVKCNPGTSFCKNRSFVIRSPGTACGMSCYEIVVARNIPMYPGRKYFV